MTTATKGLTGTRWRIDGAHSEIGFAVRHMMISTVRGRFGTVDGTVRIDEAGELHARVEIETRSIDTQVEKRDDHLRSADFFDAESFPTAVFESRETRGWTGDPGRPFELVGDLTLRGVTREVVLDTSFEGTVSDPVGGDRAAFAAETTIDRREFGLDWNQALEAGGVLVSHEVKITMNVLLAEITD